MFKLKTQGTRLLRTALLCFTLAMYGCEVEDFIQPEKTRRVVHYGPTTSMLGGTARTWVEVVNGKPAAIGVEMSEEVLQDLPDEMGMFFLQLPGQAHATGIKTVMVDWNPMGHEPEGVYNVPHFDFHFFKITEAQVKQIGPGIDEGAYKLVERGVFPSIYTFGPEPFAVPNMGVHWVDVTSPEFSPAGFSKTFIYGSLGDRVHFFEPMITVDYFKSLAPNASVKTPIPSLLKYEEPGYYPESYTIKHNAMNGTYSVALTDLERK